MPLNLAALVQSPGLPGAGGHDYPTTHAAAARVWRDALEAYVVGLVPVVAPPARAAALEQFEATLSVCFGMVTSIAELDQALAALAIGLSAGMAPAATGVPPPGTPELVKLLGVPPPPATRHDGVLRVAGRIDAWMRTGTYALPSAPTTWLVWS